MSAKSQEIVAAIRAYSVPLANVRYDAASRTVRGVSPKTGGLVVLATDVADADWDEVEESLSVPSQGTTSMRDRSGQVTSKDRLVAFLYVLATGSLPVGAIEDVLAGHIEKSQPGEDFEFTNGWLARWAEDAAARIRG